MQIWLKRAYERPGDKDGTRILVDRIWPRGVSKEDLQLDTWLKEIAPSEGLRKWFDHDPKRWDEFKRRYFAELDNRQEAMEELLSKVRNGRVTLIFAAHDEEHNNAVALKEYLTDQAERRSLNIVQEKLEDIARNKHRDRVHASFAITRTRPWRFPAG